MSYCRFAWDNSDVYLYPSAGGFECCGCILDAPWTYHHQRDLIAHLMDHLEHGHTVPRYAIDSLLDEIYSEIKTKPKPAFQRKYERMLAKAKLEIEKQKERR